MQLHHLALRTQNLTKLANFYGEVIGLELIKENKNYSFWFRAGEGVLMIEQAEKNEPRIAQNSQELIAFGLAPQLWANKKKKLIDSRLVSIENETDFTFYFRDPDGRKIAISKYHF